MARLHIDLHPRPGQGTTINGGHQRLEPSRWSSIIDGSMI
jgi:hypothetical protein